MLEGSVVQVIKENKVVEWVSCEDPICVEVNFVLYLEKYVPESEDWDEDRIKDAIIKGHFEIPDGRISILDLDSDSKEVLELEGVIE